MNHWEFFSERELACKGTEECEMNEEFMEKLIKLRKKYNRPMIISSGYRSIAYNSSINGARYSPHLYGRAVDVLCYGKPTYDLIKLAINMEMTGIGLQQRGNYDGRFVHLDDMPKSQNHNRPWIWTYK
tara:strand:- start:33 stop:416 length:384 start_codon:yes stop_codon:yes gene_type:complete